MKKVYLDAGHGGRDPGAVGNGLKEKDIVLPVTLKMGDILKRHGLEVVYSRTIDTFLELHERANKANQAKTDVFVSIHCNSATNTSARGVETYSYLGSVEGGKLAKAIQDSVINAKIFSHNRGTKTANFAVLRLTRMPAALVELGFISNKLDAEIQKTKQEEMAEAVAKGILNYLGIKYEGKSQVKVRIKGKLHYIDGFMKDNVNYVAIRQILESLGHKVGWDNAKQEVLVD